MSFAAIDRRLDLVPGETYAFVGGSIVRTVACRDGRSSTSSVPLGAWKPVADPAALYDRRWLMARDPFQPDHEIGTVRVADLFAGCGGLSIGIREACRALGTGFEAVMANDLDRDTLDVYGLNFPTATLRHEPIEEFLDSAPGEPLSLAERRLKHELGEIDIVVGGPPCQGHSTYNNHTRNNDPKNELYMKMARFCEVVGPRHVVIENVPGVERDRLQVAQRTWQVLRDLGYQVSSGVIDASRIGVAQRRKRSVTLASRMFAPSVAEAVESVEVVPRGLEWAIDDLRHRARTDGPFDTPPEPNPTNQARIDYLRVNGLYDLPDEQRPDCHRLKEHTYFAVYGRLRWDVPSPTITTGFGSMGQGRYVHPDGHRLITPHEAARIQFFPDSYSFGGARRTLLQRMIGNAVPAKMGYAVGLHLLR